MKNLINSQDLTKIELEKLFVLSDKMNKRQKKYDDSLKGFVIATLFYEPSTRTRLSFESAIQKLGAGLISTENAKESGSAKKGETLEDTIKIIQGYADMIILRHFDNDSSDRALKVASVPIINAGAGNGEHPPQGLLDIYTIRQYKKEINNTSIAIIGDLKNGRTVHSLIKLLCLYENITFYGFSVKGLELPKNYIEYIESHNAKYFICKDFSEIPSDVNFIYQTRIQTERLENKNFSIEDIILNKERFSRFSENTYIMHPLPRTNEISTDLDDDKRSIYFKQAHNGIPTKMALIYSIIKDFYKNKKHF